jgi:molybdopterin molybdotransferase
MTLDLSNLCYSQVDLLDVDECTQRILQFVGSDLSVEDVDLNASMGRVLAKDLYSPIDVPVSTYSAMDGYAVNIPLGDQVQTKFTIRGKLKAGDHIDCHVEGLDAIKVMTGAVIPRGANCVIPLECVVKKGNGFQVLIAESLTPNANIRFKGEEICKGELVLSKNRRITASCVTLMAALGIDKIPVLRCLKIGVFSTGNELTEPGKVLENDTTIFDANRYSLQSNLQAYPVDIIDYGILEDNVDVVVSTLKMAAKDCDIIISTAGVSKGDADIIRLAAQQYGGINTHQVKMKPGKPIAFGKFEQALFFGLPGNPVAAVVSFKRFVEPAIREWLDLEPLRSISMLLDGSILSKMGRTEYIRGKAWVNDSAEMCVVPVKRQGAAQITGLLQANALIEVPESCARLEQGSLVQVWPLTTDFLDLI